MITLVSIVTFSTIAYSVYVDVSGVFSTLSSPGKQGSASQLVVTGNTAKLDLDYSIQNSGLYPLLVAFSCQPDANAPLSCADVSVSIPVGSTQVVGFAITVSDLSKLRSLVSAGNPLHLNATAAFSLEPFATLSARFDLGNALSGAVQ